MRGNQVGKVVWHSLERDGTIAQYDIKFGNKTIERIPAALVESVSEDTHEHRERKIK